MQSSLAHAMPPSASSKLAAELVNQDPKPETLNPKP